MPFEAIIREGSWVPFAPLVAAQAALAAGIAEKESVTAEFASLERTIDERKNRIDAALSGARTNAARRTYQIVLTTDVPQSLTRADFIPA